MDWKFAEPYTYKALFAVPYGGPKDQNRLAYSFDYGDVHYVSLNTDYEELNGWRPTMMEDEAAWLDKDLAAAKKAGKRLVVLMHRPPWDSPYNGTLDVNGKYFMPLFDKYDVPWYLRLMNTAMNGPFPSRTTRPLRKGPSTLPRAAPGQKPGMARSRSRLMSFTIIQWICPCT